jgi:hypothetical protein
VTEIAAALWRKLAVFPARADVVMQHLTTLRQNSAQ